MQGIQDRLEDVGSRLGPFADAFEAVQREIREKFKQSSQHHGVWEGLQEFAHAVKWTVSDPHTPLSSLSAIFYLPESITSSWHCLLTIVVCLHIASSVLIVHA